MTYREELQHVIHERHGVHSHHVQSVSVTEKHNGRVIWDGVVEVFKLQGHPQATHAYAWIHETDDPNQPKRSDAVLNIPPATTPEDAVRVAIIRDLLDAEARAYETR